MKNARTIFNAMLIMSSYATYMVLTLLFFLERQQICQFDFYLRYCIVGNHPVQYLTIKRFDKKDKTTKMILYSQIIKDYNGHIDRFDLMDTSENNNEEAKVDH